MRPTLLGFLAVAFAHSSARLRVHPSFQWTGSREPGAVCAVARARWLPRPSVVCVCREFVYKVTEPSPLRGSSACAKRAAYPEPPRSPTQNPSVLYRGSIARVWFRPELFPGIGVLPGPATGSHIVNRVTRLGRVLEFNYLGNVKSSQVDEKFV